MDLNTSGGFDENGVVASEGITGLLDPYPLAAGKADRGGSLLFGIGIDVRIGIGVGRLGPARA